jgi:hypothetical protein
VYPVHAICKWVRDYYVSLQAVSSSDPLLVGGEESAGLERYRNARADREEITVRKLRKEVVSVDEVVGGLMRGMEFIRAAGDELQRKFGPEAHAILDGAIDNAVRMFDDTIGDADAGKNENDT